MQSLAIWVRAWVRATFFIKMKSEAPTLQALLNLMGCCCYGCNLRSCQRIRSRRAELTHCPDGCNCRRDVGDSSRSKRYMATEADGVIERQAVKGWGGGYRHSLGRGGALASSIHCRDNVVVRSPRGESSLEIGTGGSADLRAADA